MKKHHLLPYMNGMTANDLRLAIVKDLSEKASRDILSLIHKFSDKVIIFLKSISVETLDRSCSHTHIFGKLGVEKRSLVKKYLYDKAFDETYDKVLPLDHLYKMDIELRGTKGTKIKFWVCMVLHKFYTADDIITNSYETNPCYWYIEIDANYNNWLEED
jgi:hypothetical protein